MQRFQHDEVELNLTPMIDIVLLLLCFFVLTSKFSAPPEAINLELPASQSSTQITKDATLVDLQRDGLVRINQQKYALDTEFSAALKALGAQQQELVIRADAEVSHGLVVRLMDLANRQGYSNMRIATSREY